MLEAAHQRDLKVVLDGVFNHASRGFFYFNDILENGPASPWLDWFKIEHWPLSAYDGSQPANYGSWVNNRALPEFNHHNPQAREYIMQVAEYWISQGVDGWRLDVPFEIQVPGFWQEFRERVKAINPEAYLVGEIWTDARQWLDGAQFDGVMNYLFTGPTLAFTASSRVVKDLVEQPPYHPYPPLDAPGYADKIQTLLALYPWEIQLTQLNLLSSHDVARVLSVVDGDLASVKLAVLLQMTFPGAPSIYYGDEVGLAGKVDPDCRRVFPPSAEWNIELLQWHRDLIRLRRQHPVLSKGDYRLLAAQQSAYAFARILMTQSPLPSALEAVIVAVNVGESPAQLPLSEVDFMDASGEVQIWFGEGNIHRQNSTLTLEIPPRSGLVIGRHQ